MSDLRRLQRLTSLILFAFVSVAALALLAAGYPQVIGGLIAGSLLGLANLAWMIATAARFMSRQATARRMQAAAAVRFVAVVSTFGVLLIIGRFNPIGAVIGYAAFPIAAATAGWVMTRQPVGATL
jgi:ATP synthase I chain